MVKATGCDRDGGDFPEADASPRTSLPITHAGTDEGLDPNREMGWAGVYGMIAATGFALFIAGVVVCAISTIAASGCQSYRTKEIDIEMKRLELERAKTRPPVERL